MATQAEVCEHLGLGSSTSLKTLIKRGVIPAGTPRGGLDLNLCRINYLNYLRARAKGIIQDEEDTDKKDYQQLLDKERWRKMKRSNDLEERLLVPIVEMDEKIEKLASEIIPILQTIVPNIKRQFPELTGDQALIIEESITSCLNKISEIEL